jgi:membrane-bound ClpP family serine protease
MTAFTLLIIGLLLIFIEFYVPGAVMGIAGGVFLLASLILFAVQTDSPWLITLYLCAMVICVGYLIKYALWRIRHAKPDRSIYCNHSQEGYQASSYDMSAIGKKGTVISDLKPGGYILIEGKQHQAISQEGYLTKGTEVMVVSGQEESLIVRAVKKENL